jgi:acyl-coenzyme A synthetase/AMP-(fatty) acid ligase
MYTSGSTGHSKGVMVEHRAIVRLVCAQSYFAGSGRERFLQFAPITFDASTFEIWGALLNGATLVVAPPGHRSLDELAEMIATQRVTVAWLTASLFNQFVNSDIGSLRCLRRLITGGDVVSVGPVTMAGKKMPWCVIVNGYGPTETTTFACCHNITAEDAPIPIGRPIANTRVYILDAHLEPMPIGVPGELYIGGDGVARGYWRREDLTGERFVADPFVPGGRLYRTGDLARYRGDGAIEFLGRRDDQVKIRGFRIEPGEVEAALGHHPDLQAVAVVARSVDGDEKQLVAYVVPGGGARRPAAEELRGFLAQRLPDYMIPATFVALDRLPVTLNGKLDRARLPAPSSDRPQLETAFAAPATELERRIAAIWRRLLDRTEVGVNDNFFDLGGHSLLLMRVQRALQEDLVGPIKLVDMFQFPTIRALAQHLAAAALPPAQATSPSMPTFDAVRQRVSKQQQAFKQRAEKSRR